MRRALLSVSDKTGIVDFARGLAAGGFEIVSTGGTARALADAGVAVVQVSSVTGFPEMMDGRVKTLHPAVHAGILARRDEPGDLRALDDHGIRPVDIVAVNLYPFARVAADPDAGVGALIEEIDIGGPTLVRAAAKNFRDVVVVVDPGDYPEALEALRRPGGPGPDFRLALARKAFAHTASYDGAIASTLSAVEVADGRFTRAAAPAEELVPDTLEVRAERRRTLRYGENPHQAAALYAAGEAGFGGARVVQGKPLSFTNLLDLDAAARLAREFDEPAAVVVKHTNPCGVATAGALSDAYVSAREVDALSAFGGIVGLNRGVDRMTAEAIASTFIEAVVAPDADDEARAVLAAKKNLRLVLADCSSAGDVRSDRDVRSILGAILVQGGDRVTEAAGPWTAEAAGRPESGLRGADPAAADRGGVGGPPAGLAGHGPREVERGGVRAGGSARGDRRRPDEPGRRGEGGGDEGGRADRHGGRLRCVLPVPRRPRCDRGGRGDRGGPTRGVGAGRRGRRRRRRARPRDGVHGTEALPALSERRRARRRRPSPAVPFRAPVRPAGRRPRRRSALAQSSRSPPRSAARTPGSHFRSSGQTSRSSGGPESATFRGADSGPPAGAVSRGARRDRSPRAGGRPGAGRPPAAGRE